MTPIELAPQHKTGLQLDNPLLVAAGCWGLGTEYLGLVAGVGGVVVGPVTMRARPGTAPPRSAPVPGGVLLHTGLANPGLTGLLRHQGRAWARLPFPVILHLAATTVGEVTAAGLRLSSVEAIAAVELGLSDGVEPDEAAALVAAARRSLPQPLLVRLPLHSAGQIAAAVARAGADSLVVAAPPRGAASMGERFVTGWLYGPFVLPLALRALRQVREAVDAPLVGCGGIYSVEDGLAFLRAGASAVQVDAALWRDPAGVTRMAREMAAADLTGQDL